MKTLNLSKLSLAVVFTLSSASALAQTPSFTEGLEGRVMSYSEFVDNKSNQKMLMTFADQSQAGSIVFNIDHTCGYVLGTLNLNDPTSIFGGGMNIKLNKFGSTHRCSTEEFDDLRTLVTADNINSIRLFTTQTTLSSKVTGATLSFSDVTKEVEAQRARQAVLDTYWVRGSDSASGSHSDEKPSVDLYLERVQQAATDFPYFVVHNHALRIFESDKTDTGIAAETYVGGMFGGFNITNGMSSESIVGNQGTTFGFDGIHGRGVDLTQGSIKFGQFHWLERIFLEWPRELSSKNRFQVNGDSLTLSSDTSEETIQFNRLVKSAKIEDLKSTEWVGNIASENVTAKFASHSLEEMLVSFDGIGSRALVKLSANDSGSFNKAQVVGATHQHAMVTTLSNALPEVKSVVLDYSDANSRKLHIITESEIFSLTEKRAAIPITFN